MGDCMYVCVHMFCAGGLGELVMSYAVFEAPFQ